MYLLLFSLLCCVLDTHTLLCIGRAYSVVYWTRILCSNLHTRLHTPNLYVLSVKLTLCCPYGRKKEYLDFHGLSSSGTNAVNILILASSLFHPLATTVPKAKAKEDDELAALADWAN